MHGAIAEECANNQAVQFADSMRLNKVQPEILHLTDHSRKKYSLND